MNRNQFNEKLKSHMKTAGEMPTVSGIDQEKSERAADNETAHRIVSTATPDTSTTGTDATPTTKHR